MNTVGKGRSCRSVGMISLKTVGFDLAADTSVFPQKAALPDAAFFIFQCHKEHDPGKGEIQNQIPIILLILSKELKRVQ